MNETRHANRDNKHGRIAKRHYHSNRASSNEVKTVASETVVQTMTRVSTRLTQK